MAATVQSDVNAPFSDYYVWRDLDTRRTTCFHPHMIDRLQQDILQAINESGGRRREIGGVLLGSVHSEGAQRVTIIDGFQAVSLRHQCGPAYSPSHRDHEVFERTLSALSAPPTPLAVVGYWRSHNRDGLFLSAADLALIGRYFAHEAGVFLLVKTLPSGACTGGLFFREEGVIQHDVPSLELPFAPPEPPLPKALNSLEHGLTAAVPDRVDAAAGGKLYRTISNWFLRGPVRLKHAAIACVFMSATVLPFFLSKAVRVLPGAQQTISDAGLGLTVTRQARQLVLSWNTGSLQALAAQRAVLSIHDGPRGNRALPLSTEQLHAGSVLFTPEGEDIAFRLELYRQGKPVAAETLRLVIANAQADVVTPKPPRSKEFASHGSVARDGDRISAVLSSLDPLPPGSSYATQLSFVAPAMAASAPSDRAGPELPIPNGPGADVNSSSTIRDRNFAAIANLIGLRAMPAPASLALPPDTAADSPAAQPRPTPPAPEIADRRASTNPNPAAPPTFSAPVIVYRVTPVLPASLRAFISTPIDVEVSVAIDPHGSVADARVTSVHGGAAGLLVPEAMKAARQFRFKPAARSGVPIKSSMFLVFHFERSGK